MISATSSISTRLSIIRKTTPPANTWRSNSKNLALTVLHTTASARQAVSALRYFALLFYQIVDRSGTLHMFGMERRLKPSTRKDHSVLNSIELVSGTDFKNFATTGIDLKAASPERRTNSPKAATSWC
jgi:hypothetical protein